MDTLILNTLFNARRPPLTRPHMGGLGGALRGFLRFLSGPLILLLALTLLH